MRTFFKSQWALFCATLLVSLGMYAYGKSIETSIQAELKTYVPQKEFIDYKDDHKSWSIEKLNDMSSKFQEIGVLLKEMKRDNQVDHDLLIRLAERWNVRTNSP